MKLIQEHKKCIGCGVCVANCPGYFKMSKDGKAEIIKGKKVKDNQELDIEKETSELKEAKESCPVQCIKISK